MKKLISWNVNGFRAILSKNFMDFFQSVNADIFCLQETKIQEGQVQFHLENYNLYWNYAEKKGYSGTALFSKEKPLEVTYGIGMQEHDSEGRVITAEYDQYYVVTVYTPNSQRELTRLNYRMQWEDAFLRYLQSLEIKKPVIVCGDLNVAHKEIDLKNPKANTMNAGFTKEEREKFSALIEYGFIDTFRYFYPEKTDAYTWWSYMAQARTKNIGWRIDYFCTSGSFRQRLVDAKIHADILGSDHCPVELLIQ